MQCEANIVNNELTGRWWGQVRALIQVPQLDRFLQRERKLLDFANQDV